MKLERLDLLAFGSLRDVSLELQSAEPCLHVIYGANEAGKSTALRALSGLFYGIPESTRDAHSLEPSKLRVGAVLCDARGRRLHVVRRKGRKDTLLLGGGEREREPLPAADASWITAGVQESTFHALFGLSFETLHRGAQDLLGAAGDLGQSLFSAAVGGGRVRRVLEELEEEASKLFRPRGRTQPLNAALLVLDELRKKSRDAMVNASTITEQQAGIEAAEARSLELHGQALALRAERERLERFRRVLPLLARQRALRAEHAELGEVVRLAPEATAERRKAEVDRREAQLRLTHAQAEVQRLEQERAQVAHSIQAGLGELPVSEVELLRDRLVGYKRCQRSLPAKREALARARAEVQRALTRLQLPAAQLQDLERLRLPARLVVRVREHQQTGERLRARLGELGRSLADQREQLQRLRRKLWLLWLPALPALPESSEDQADVAPLLARSALPSAEQCEDAERAFAEHAQSLKVLDGKLDDVEQRLERNRRARETLSLSGAPPTEAELAERRAVRGAAFDELRALLREAPGDPRGLPLLERAVALTELVDGLHDRLRREADRVAQAAALQAELRDLTRAQESLTGKRTALAQRQAALEAKWQAPFNAAGVPLRTPREARNLVTAQRALEQQCEQLERELARTDRELSAASGEERSWIAGWSELASELGWSELTSELGLTQRTSAAELEALLEARTELLARHDDAQALERECADLQREADEFAALTTDLCRAHLPALASLPPEAAAERLIQVHRETHAALAQLAQLTATLRARQQAGGEAQRELAQAERRIALLMQAAGVSEPAQLEAAEQRSARASDLEAALTQLDSELAASCDGRDPQQIAAEVEGSLDEVRARLTEIDERLSELDDERHRVTQLLGGLRAGLSRLHETHAAGDAASEVHSQLDEVRALTQRYVRLRLSASALKREIEQYRERHRAPVLQVAGELFTRLTLGAYQGLDVEYGEHDEPVLSCVRHDQVQLRVPALSTGTRDQLYLALRLASIQHLSTERELMPLILDDILVHFDDDRARAALTTLAEFAGVTQVIFFTHHERLCELARAALPPERVRIHRLPTTTIARALELTVGT